MRLSAIAGMLASVFILLLLLYRSPLGGVENQYDYTVFTSKLMVGSIVGFSLAGVSGHLRWREASRSPARLGGVDLDKIWPELAILSFLFWGVWTWGFLLLQIQSGA